MLHRPDPDPAPDEQVHRISAAPIRHSDDLSQRINRYLVSMAIRTICVVLVVVVQGPLRWLFAVGAIGLPYVAVILANASRRPREDGPEGPTARARGSLTTGAEPGPQGETVTATYTVTGAPELLGTPAQPVPGAAPEPAGDAGDGPVTVLGTVLESHLEPGPKGPTEPSSHGAERPG